MKPRRYTIKEVGNYQPGGNQRVNAGVNSRITLLSLEWTWLCAFRTSCWLRPGHVCLYQCNIQKILLPRRREKVFAGEDLQRLLLTLTTHQKF